MYGTTIILVLGILLFLGGYIWLLVRMFSEDILWGLGALIFPVVWVIFLILHWDAAKKPILVTVSGLAMFGLALLAVVRAKPSLASATPPAEASSGAQPAAVHAPSPSAAAVPSEALPAPENLQSFAAKGCRLSAPAGWTVQTETDNAATKLVIADPAGKSTVGIHTEPASGTTLSQRDVAKLMEQAERMPLRLEDSNWTSVEDNKAWREVRKGAFGGSQRTWIRYSYHQSSAVVQVIGVVKGQASREERELLETIMRSCHCDS